MAGGKANIVMMFLPVILQCGGFLKKRYLVTFVLFGALSIVIVGMFQMNMSFAQSVSYNIYRATSLSNMGTLCVWDKFPTGDPQAYMSLFNWIRRKNYLFLI